MKIALFLFLVLMNCSTVFAYQVKVTKLTDENFDPLMKGVDVSYRDSIKEYQSNYKDKQIATITLIFKFIEIGKDYDAATTLAKKEAAKLGADLIIYISHTIYKDTEDIASMTYRCVRSQSCDDMEKPYKEIKANENVRKELETSIFFKKIQEKFMLFDKIEENKQLKMLGIKWKTIKNKENQRDGILCIS